MPYTAHHLYNCADYPVVQNATASRMLSAQSDADAIREADRWLRASRVVAHVAGEEIPVAETVLKDGQEIACITLRVPS